MIIHVKEASREQKPVLERLAQLYLYDFSEVEGHDVGQGGLFEHSIFRLDSYWTEPDRFPFLIYVNVRIAGFVLVNSYTCLVENIGAKSIAEFFIMRRYRRQGVGKKAAFDMFDKYPGKWEVRQIKANVTGREFWRSVIDEYTGGRFEETVLDDDLWRGPAQSFESIA